MTFLNDANDERPAINGTVVTPSDSVDLPNATKWLYIGGAGNVKVTLLGGDTLLLTALAVGVLHRIAVTRVWSGTTTATAIIAFG